MCARAPLAVCTSKRNARRSSYKRASCSTRARWFPLEFTDIGDNCARRRTSGAVKIRDKSLGEARRNARARVASPATNVSLRQDDFLDSCVGEPGAGEHRGRIAKNIARMRRTERERRGYSAKIIESSFAAAATATTATSSELASLAGAGPQRCGG